MANKSITIEVSEAVYNTLQAAAEASALPVEHFSLDDLRPLFDIDTNPDTDAIMESMKDYTDSQLWIVVGRRMATTKSERMYHLLALNKEGQLSAAEDAELDAFVTEVNHDMLLRSEALALLHERGYDVSKFFQPDV